MRNRNLPLPDDSFDPPPEKIDLRLDVSLNCGVCRGRSSTDHSVDHSVEQSDILMGLVLIVRTSKMMVEMKLLDMFL